MHRVLLLVVEDQAVVIFSHEDALVFEVNGVETRGLWYGKWEGVVRPNLEWQTELLTNEVQGTEPEYSWN